jgi:hypothetical protein
MGGSAASSYAAMTSQAALAELDKRAIPHAKVAKVAEASGVLTPVRLTGPVHGVRWHTDVPEAQRASTPWEVFDAALVLALDDFGAILASHDIDEVVLFSAWRPPSKGWEAGKIGIRHPGAMAVDARRFHKKSSDLWIDIEDDFHGNIGAVTCGEGAAAPTVSSEFAIELHALVCDAADKRMFHSILTPNHDGAHRNHLHLEVRRGVSWVLID